jgi:hypothetical protein
LKIGCALVSEYGFESCWSASCFVRGASLPKNHYGSITPQTPRAERPPRDKQTKEMFLIVNTVKEERGSKSNQRRTGGWEEARGLRRHHGHEQGSAGLG